MTKELEQWCNENFLQISESQQNGSDIVEVDGFGKLLYLHPFDGKVIDEDFAFILSDEEFEILDNGQVDYILFEFGGMFYYSAAKTTKNKYNEVI